MIDHRLFRYDFRIAVNATHAIFPRWRDRLLGVALLSLALMLARAWALDQPWAAAAWAAAGGALLAGLSGGRAVAARLAFHGFDGPLAAAALQPASRRRYSAACHLAALAAVAVVTAIARPSLLAGTVAGYPLGALAGHAIGGRADADRADVRRLGRTARAWRARPWAGGIAAILLLASLSLLSPSPGRDAPIAVVGVEAALLALALTGVDHGVVRFMTMTGWRAWRVVAHHARGVTLFACIASAVGGLAAGRGVAWIVAAVSGGALVVMTMRILSYCLHPRRGADLLVSILSGVLILTAVAATIALPLVAVAILCHLHRRAARETWRMA